MKRRMLISITAVGGAALLMPKVFEAQVLDVNDAINKAGRQRMLSQRLAKAYAAIGQKVLVEAADKVMSASMALFDRQLVELKAFAPTQELKSTYGALEAAWSDYKTALVGSAPSKLGDQQVLRLQGDVLRLANQGTVQFEAVSGRATGKLVNISGRQRMLSQRMAAFYLSASWGVEPAQAIVEMDKARDEFVKAHALLKSAPETTAVIRSELDLAEAQYVFFDAALHTLRPGATRVEDQNNVFTTSERILQVMDKATGLYAKLA